MTTPSMPRGPHGPAGAPARRRSVPRLVWVLAAVVVVAVVLVTQHHHGGSPAGPAPSPGSSRPAVPATTATTGGPATTTTSPVSQQQPPSSGAFAPGAPAYQHIPYIGMGIQISVSGTAPNGMLDLYVYSAALTDAQVRAAYLSFLALYHDSGAQYVPTFVSSLAPTPPG